MCIRMSRFVCRLRSYRCRVSPVLFVVFQILIRITTSPSRISPDSSSLSRCSNLVVGFVVGILVRHPSCYKILHVRQFCSFMESYKLFVFRVGRYTMVYSHTVLLALLVHKCGSHE